MANALEDSRQVFLTYRDVKLAHPEWSDAAIEDYMAGKQDFVTLSDDIGGIDDRLDAIEARLTYLEGLTIVTAVGLTIDNAVTGHQTIICTAEVTISLDATPNDRDTAEIKQTGFRVIIDGNGKTIEGESSLTIRGRSTRLKTGLVLRYSEEADEWYVI